MPPNFNPKSPKSRRDLATSLRIAVPHGTDDSPRRRARQVSAGSPSASRSCATSSAPTRATSAPTARRTPGGPSAGGGSSARRSACSAGSRAAPTPWPARSTGSATPSKPWATSPTAARWSPSDGERLRRLYTEKDLLAAECLRHDVWKRLDAAGLAAAVSALVHEPRHEEAEVSPRMPNDEVAEALTRMSRLWSEIEDLETEHDLPSTSMPDGGMAWMVHRWASGERLDTVLRGQDMAAGDFVRRCKQIVDLLDQVAKAATDGEPAPHGPRRGGCRAARRRRGRPPRLRRQ